MWMDMQAFTGGFLWLGAGEIRRNSNLSVTSRKVAVKVVAKTMDPGLQFKTSPRKVGCLEYLVGKPIESIIFSQTMRGGCFMFSSGQM